jgi:hypothetical protein
MMAATTEMSTSRGAALIAVGFVLLACGQSTPTASVRSPTPSVATSASASPSSSAGAAPSASPAPAATPPPAAAGTRLVIQDYAHTQVRLARFDAVDVATVPGNFDGAVGGQAIVLNGTTLLAVAGDGSVRTLGHLTGAPEWNGPGTVAVNPSVTQWVYTIVDVTNLNAAIHLGSPASDRLIASLPSPDNNAFYQPFAWNSSGVYIVKEATGLGGVGPFLEYHFPIAKLDLTTGQVTIASPECVAEGVLDDGTLLCRTAAGGVEVRSRSGASHVIQIGTSTTGGANGVYSRLTVTPDEKRFAAARNGNSNPNLINYQTVTANLSGSSVGAFGPADFYPDTWLPDGRLVGDHLCWSYQGNGGPCTQSLDGTYFISADGAARTLFFKLAQGASVVGFV